MNPENERHLRAIYSSMPDDLFRGLINHLDSLFDKHSKMLSPHTKSERTGYILQWDGTQYFSVVHGERSSPVVFAGAIETRENGRAVAAIRFSDDNPSLRSVPSQFLFPYRKPNWTNVELTRETLGSIPELFDSQVRLHDQRYINRS